MRKKFTQLSYRYYSAATVCMLMVLTTYAQTPKLNSSSSAVATVYLDFDGHTVEGTAWNWDSTIHAQSAKLTNDVITEIFDRVTEDYRIFDLNITTDSAVFAKAPFDKRERIIITPTSKWYGDAAGAAYVNSFNWADGTPAFVFSDKLFKNAKYIGEAVSHEVGHTFGLQHQCTYDNNCQMVTEYAEGRGDGETGWAPIMGVGYYKNMTTWHTGPNVIACDFIQNDIDVITMGGLPLRKDDHGNNIQSATAINKQGANFQLNGMINNAADKDFFKIVLTSPSAIRVTILPNSVGASNSGANIDIELNLLNSNGKLIKKDNPKNLLSATLDTSLKSGTYFLQVDGVGNENTTDYGSIGYYSITGTADVMIPVTKLVVKGEVKLKEHLINWEFEADETIKETIIEYSNDGNNFKQLHTFSPVTTNYTYQPFASGAVFYRVRMIADQDDGLYYSNVISLESPQVQNISLYSNMVTSTALLNINGNYSYQLIDETGRLLQRGKLTQGLNNISLSSNRKGLMLLRVFNEREQSVFRLIKQ